MYISKNKKLKILLLEFHARVTEFLTFYFLK